MILKRDLLTAEEVLSIGIEKLDKLLYELCVDFTYGSHYFFKDNPKDVLIVKEGDKYPRGAYPLFTSGELLEVLEFGHQVDIRSFGHGWLILWSADTILESREGERFVAFLWRVVIELFDQGKLGSI